MRHAGSMGCRKGYSLLISLHVGSIDPLQVGLEPANLGVELPRLLSNITLSLQLQ